MANCKFEFVSKFQDCGLALPERKTRYSAGYDLACAEDCVIPSYHSLMDIIRELFYPIYETLFPTIDIRTKVCQNGRR